MFVKSWLFVVFFCFRCMYVCAVSVAVIAVVVGGIGCRGVQINRRD
jgi:hypothetical protein